MGRLGVVRVVWMLIRRVEDVSGMCRGWEMDTVSGIGLARRMSVLCCDLECSLGTGSTLWIE